MLLGKSRAPTVVGSDIQLTCITFYMENKLNRFIFGIESDRKRLVPDCGKGQLWSMSCLYLAYAACHFIYLTNKIAIFMWQTNESNRF